MKSYLGLRIQVSKTLKLKNTNESNTYIKNNKILSLKTWPKLDNGKKLQTRKRMLSLKKDKLSKQ
jgi:hypothetical protein